MRSAWQVIVCLILVVIASQAFGWELRSFVCQNMVTDVDYRDGVLAVSTTVGLWVVSDAGMRKVGTADGLPSDWVVHAKVAGPNRIYTGPFWVSGGRERDVRVYLVELGPSLEVTVTDVTPDYGLYGCFDAFDVSPDGCLWVGDFSGLHRFDESKWEMFPTVDFGSLAFASLAFGRDQEVFVCQVGKIYELTEGEFVFISAPFLAQSIRVGPQGDLWAVGDGALWRRRADDWEKVSEDEAWDGLAVAMRFDDSGRLWVPMTSSLAVYDPISGETLELTEAAGVSFMPGRRYYSFFSSCAARPDGAMFFGTYGSGLLVFDCNEFSRIFVEDSVPGDGIIDICEDEDGRVWVVSQDAPIIGIYDGGHWSQISAGWIDPALLVTGMLALDLDGSLWFRTSAGASRFKDNRWSFYDSSNSPLDSTGCVAVDGEGTKWFVHPVSPSWATGPSEKAAVSLHAREWKRYPATEYFQSQHVFRVTVGPEDEKWFARRRAVGSGFTVYDGENWRQLEVGDELPCWGPIYFDLEGNALLSGFNSWEEFLLRQTGPDQWERILDRYVSDLQADSDGTLWCAATDGVYWGGKGSWQRLGKDEGLFPAEAYRYPGPSWTSVDKVFIDHNGDKWIGTSDGLSVLNDGGPAAQRLTLKVAGPERGTGGRTASLVAEVINTATPITVALWVACEHDGRLFYYPSWSSTPAFLPIVLPAHLFGEFELASIDLDSLEPGRYTFMGAISLTGRGDLLIGQRGKKISYAVLEN